MERKQPGMVAAANQPGQSKSNAVAAFCADIGSHLQAAQQQVSSCRGVIYVKCDGEKTSVTPISASVSPFSLARKCRITCFGQAMLPTIQVHCFVKTAVSLFIVSAPIVVTFNRCSKLPVRSQFLFYYNITAQSKFQHVNYHVLQPIFAPAWRPKY